MKKLTSKFVGLVAVMRSQQKEYFKTRNIDCLKQAKIYEKQVDAEIEEYLQEMALNGNNE